MRATQILWNEHRVIEQVLACLEKMAELCETEGSLESEPARNAVDFFRSFADRCHHGKEEEQLFPLMEQRGFSPDAGPTAVMRAEHVRGRTLVGRLDAAIEGASAGKPDDARAFMTSAREYVALLRAHIEKEDHCLFPMADQALYEADQVELLRRFERVEREEIGEEVQTKFRRIADELADRLGVPRSAAKAGAAP